MIYKILGQFVNTLTADDKHYLLNRDNLMQPIQTPLSPNQKTFSAFFFFFFFFAFLKRLLNFKHFSKKDDPHSYCISEIKGSEKRR